jgi:hypothetical protein
MGDGKDGVSVKVGNNREGTVREIPWIVKSPFDNRSAPEATRMPIEPHQFFRREPPETWPACSSARLRLFARLEGNSTEQEVQFASAALCHAESTRQTT